MARSAGPGASGPEEPADGPGGTVGPTPLRALVVAALFGALAGWVVVVVSNAFDLAPPRPPWTAPLALLMAAVVIGALARATRRRLHVHRRRMDPHRAVSYLALGKASALAGALVVGGYLAFALMFVGRLDADVPRERVIRSGAAVVAGIALCVAGLLLERACRVPEDDDDQDARGAPSDRPG